MPRRLAKGKDLPQSLHNVKAVVLVGSSLATGPLARLSCDPEGPGFILFCFSVTVVHSRVGRLVVPGVAWILVKVGGAGVPT